LLTNKKLTGTKIKGQKAESFALKYLQSYGLKLITRNFSCKCGEIDLIMHDDEYLVFVEVRYRKEIQHGHPLETIDARKQQKIINTVQYYLLKYPHCSQYPCRIDAVAINSGSSGSNGGVAENKIEWVQNAIQLN
jgi:putative endonuclease